MTLLQCQEDAVKEWIAKGGRAMLSSPVGHGKTLVAAACFKASMDKYPAPALYLTTKTAMKEQVAKFRDFGLLVGAVEGGKDARITNCWMPIQPFVLVATLEMLACSEDEWKHLRKVPWGCIIIDEGDRLTAGASKRNRRLLTLNPRHKLMMSGTILKNGLKDAYFPVMWLSQTAPWRNWTDFKTRELLFQNPMVPNMMTGIRDEDYLASLVKPLVITMTNPDAPKELVAEIVSVPLSDAARIVYEKMKAELIWEAKKGTLTISNAAVLNLRLRQFVSMPEALGVELFSDKEYALTELLEKVEGKTIVFTSFASVARILADRYGWPCIEGATSNKNRQRILESAPDVLVATSACERGVDCAWVSNIISLDQGFTPAVMRQRAGRATRYGRSGDAKLYLLQCPETVDVDSEARIILSKLRQARKV